MATPGAACLDPVTVDAVADATLACMSRCVPAAVPGIAFLSGGQSDGLAGNVAAAQAALLHRACRNRAALHAEYDGESDDQPRSGIRRRADRDHG